MSDDFLSAAMGDEDTAKDYQRDESSSPPEPDPNEGAEPEEKTDTTYTSGRSDPWEEAVVFNFEDDDDGSTTRACSEAADILLDEHDFITLRDSGEVYYYDPDVGYYRRKGETYIAELLNEHIPHYVNRNRIRNITENVINRSYGVQAADFNPPEHKVNVKNGVIDLQAIETTTNDEGQLILDVDTDDVLKDHSPDYHFTAALDCRFEPRVHSDLLDDQLARTLDDEDERKKLLEFVGYCLEPWHHDREKNLHLVGPSATGKSTIQETIESLFGSAPTVSNLTPQQIADTKFDGAMLYEASLNTVNDINSTKVKDTGTLKRVWSGERTKMENKFKDAFSAAPTAKHLYTANWLPNMVGQDESVYRRVLIVECTNKIRDEDIDRTVKRRLNSEEVRQALLNKALIARERLHDQDDFTNDRNRNQTRLKWDSWRDSHKRFLHTQFHITGISSDHVDQAAYHRAFEEFIGRTGYQMKSKASIGASIKWMPEVEANRDGQQPVYTGLRWKHDDATETVESTQERIGLDDDLDDTVSDQDDTPQTGDERLHTVEQVVEQHNGLRFAELRATLGRDHDIAPDDATQLIETAIDTDTIVEEDAGMLLPK